MNDSILRKFCESRHRKLIVVIATTLFGLLVLIPLVDDYFDKKASHSALTEDLDRARQTVDGLPTLVRQSTKIGKQLVDFESRTVTSESVSEYRTKVVGMVRETGCQVRRLDVASPAARPWLENDNPLEVQTTNDKKSRRTPFTLERRNVALTVDGTMESLRIFLEKLNQDNSVAYMHNLVIQSAGRNGDQVTADIEMWLFNLERQKI